MARNMMEQRRSTAVQFFTAEDQEHDEKSTYDRVVELINQASLLPKDTQKVASLKKAQELIVHKEPALMDNFLDEIMAFQHDKSIEVRRFVVGFIEESCKKDPEIFRQVIANLLMMMADEAVAVVKKVIQSFTQIYRVALAWICRAKNVTPIMESTWQYVTEIKTKILTLIDSDNDGVRTFAVKFMEMLVIVQTFPEPDTVKKNELDIALDDIPSNIKFMKVRNLEEEGKQVFDALVVFHGSPHISSVNLMTCMGSLATIAKQRSEYIVKVIQALEALHANLPPTLAKCQVSSVRKHLKNQLLNLLKRPAALEYHSQITTLLTDLGATQQEVLKCVPKPEEVKKRARAEENLQAAKRLKAEVVVDPEDEKEEVKPMRAAPKGDTKTAIDITAKDLVPRLVAQNVVDIVLLSMVALPDAMPAQFQSSYTPIAGAGTEGQIEHLARLLATQFTAAGLGTGVEEVEKGLAADAQAKEAEADGIKQTIQTVVGGAVATQKKEKPTWVTLLPTGTQQGKMSKRPGLKQLKLSEITKPIPADQIKIVTRSALQRILNSDRGAIYGGAGNSRMKLIGWLATYFGDQLGNTVKEFILEDIRNRADVLFTWLYEEYCSHQGFGPMADHANKTGGNHYNSILCSIIQDLIDNSEQKDRDILIRRLYLEAPMITDNAIAILKSYCEDETRVCLGVSILRELVLKRPTKQQEFLGAILALTSHEKTEVRSSATKEIKNLYERHELMVDIEGYALMFLKCLLLPEPPSMLFGSGCGRPVVQRTWTEDVAKVCLYLYLALLPVNHKLIHDLAQVYVATSAEVKRMILRVLENPVRGMGMGSPELLTLVESCPKGAETLVTRIIHLLTDRAPPSAELVARVRDLYLKRVPDVRFLIPVLNGLTKKEVIGALPKLIKLNPVVVREVFNRLLGGHGETGTNYTSPLTPAELLIALHNIESTKCDMKTIIKATSLCFGEKQIYTQEVLAVVMQQLMEQNPLPTLLMRTVLQSLSLYPRLIGFVMNILQRLILKQVWKQKKVWEGFIKCCQRTKPQSFQVLLQLPPLQLKNVFETSPDLRKPLLDHVRAFTATQRAHIPHLTMEVLLGSDEDREAQRLDSLSILVAPGTEGEHEFDIQTVLTIKKEPL